MGFPAFNGEVVDRIPGKPNRACCQELTLDEYSIMSDISVFFKPLDARFSGSEFQKAGSLGAAIHQFSADSDFPDLEQIDIALIGVTESRQAADNPSCALAADEIRKAFYQLYSGHFEPRIADLGNIEAGHAVTDTYYALSAVVDALVRKNIVPLILGGSQDLSYAQFLGYKDLEQTINVVSIDHRFDLGEAQEEISNSNYLGKIILHQPNYLFNYSNLGYQTYLVEPASLEMMSKLFFDVYRLGQIRGQVEDAEPVIRQADMLTVDMGCLKHSDSPGQAWASPNGFYAEDICQMMRYAGMSDKLSSIGIYELNTENDQHGRSASLAAQMIWCFMEGFYQRKNDFPNRSNPDYLRFHVVLQDEHQTNKDGRYEINFYKSKKSDRWWMEIPYPPNKDLKFERHTLIPCSYKDYQLATNNEIPDRWWQTYQKLC